jgi:hypothetical protein
VELCWTHRADLSALHVAYSLIKWPGRCIDNCRPVGLAAVELLELVKRLSINEDRFWEIAFALSADTPHNRDFAERVLVRLMPAAARTPQRISDLTEAVGAIEQAFANAFPRHASDMRLRIEPLRQQWEAYGPGLLFQIGRLTEKQAIAERAEVVLVEPVTGGWGMAHLITNRCHVEALLTNVHPELTETLRLAWLLSQLEFERPIYSDLINAFRLRQIAGLAMLPPTLLAAQELGLTSYSNESLRTAIELFRIDIWGDNSSAVLTEIVTVWWDTVETDRPEWRIALTGLDRMLERK